MDPPNPRRTDIGGGGEIRELTGKGCDSGSRKVQKLRDGHERLNQTVAAGIEKVAGYSAKAADLQKEMEEENTLAGSAVMPNGTEIILEITDREVKIQPVSGEPELNYFIGGDKIIEQPGTRFV